MILTLDRISGLVSPELCKTDILCIGESPSVCTFLKNNGHEVPKGPSAIIFQEWTDTRTFSYLRYTLIYNYV